MAIRLQGQVAGIATGQGPFVQISIQFFPPASQIQLQVLTQSSIVLNQLSIGQNVSVYIASSGAEQTAIEAAVVATPIDNND